MNIYAPEGTKVVALFDEKGEVMNGHAYQKSEASNYLKPKVVYTVDRIEVHSWHTTVYLKDFPGVGFNSVHFTEYIEPETEPTFTIEDMKKCWNESRIKFPNGSFSDDFETFMYNEYNIDLTKS